MKDISASRTNKKQKIWSLDENKILLSADLKMTLGQLSPLLPNRTDTTIRRKANLAGVRLLRKAA
jgi:hypothetical protein